MYPQYLQDGAAYPLKDLQQKFCKKLKFQFFLSASVNSTINCIFLTKCLMSGSFVLGFLKVEKVGISLIDESSKELNFLFLSNLDSCQGDSGGESSN